MNPFEKLGIDEDFNPFYKELDIKTPTLVQKKVIPLLLADKSLVCRAQTGTGKTLSYALPLSEKIKLIEDESGPMTDKSAPYLVVISPTKELATQITKVFKSLAHHVKLRVRMLGSTSQKPNALKSFSYEVLVTTPTKLERGLKNKSISFKQLKALVFDEADQLFDMGFMKDVNGILRHVEFSETNISFFTATLSKQMELFFEEKFRKLKLEKVLLGEDKVQRKKVETFNIQARVSEKNTLLKAFLEKTAQGRGIIFVNQKNQITELEKFLESSLPKLKYRVLHGGLEAKQRELNLKSFVNKKAQVLLASDVAARGIDVKDLEWVFNYGLPKTAIYYMHRVGRVGRAGKAGQVFNLITEYDSKLITLINQVIKEQSDVDLDMIESKMKKTSKQPKTAKTKTKRVKQTKRSKLYKK